MAGRFRKLYYVLVVLVYICCYMVDVVLDVGIINRLCCHHAGDRWYQIVNPIYCGLSFSLTYASSIICNAVAFKHFLAEFKQVSVRMGMAILALFQILPFIWFVYCIGLLCCSCYPSSPHQLMLATYTVRMFEALVEGLGQMCLQSYMVMEIQQRKLGVGNMTFEACRDDNTSSNTILSALSFTGPVNSESLVDNYIFYVSIVASLTAVSYTIVKWVHAHLVNKGRLWLFGYTCATVLTIGSRLYSQSTFGTFWKTEELFINIYWLAPILACTIASMIYACIVHNTQNLMKYLKRSFAGTCDFLSPDGIPSSAAYFICNLVFSIKYWHIGNIHLHVGLALSAYVLISNIVFAFIFRDAIFESFFEDKANNNDNDQSRLNLPESIELENMAQ